MSSSLPVRGSIPEIIMNDDNLYQGNLIGYFRNMFNYAANLNHPYHNFRHLCHILYLCYQACLYYEGKMTPRQMRNLLIAALFHDFGHSGQVSPDNINIGRSIAALKNYLKPEDQTEFEEISNLIKATEFPYTIPDDEVSLAGQIIRDADLSQALSSSWIQQVVFGLATEWGKQPIEVLKIQEPFLRKLKFHTTWAKTCFPPEDVAAKIIEARRLVDLLTSETAST